MIANGSVGSMGHQASWVASAFSVVTMSHAVCVDDWRVTFKEPEDMKIGPEIPADAQWKLVPTDP